MKKNKTKELRIKVDEDFMSEYKSFCKKSSFNLSKRIRVLIWKDMRGEIK